MIDEMKVVKMYQETGMTLRQIADELGTNHKLIGRILQRNGVEIERRYNYQYTEEHRRRIGEASKGRVPPHKGIPATETQIRRYIKARMRTQIDLDQYEDLAKLRLLIKLTSKHYKHWGHSDEVRKAFLDRFYYDEAFNAIYEAWIKSGKSKWWYPSLDHKDSKFSGGTFELSNLQFLTWFENRAKAEMSCGEWERFKVETQTTSKLFIEEILNDYRKRR